MEKWQEDPKAVAYVMLWKFGPKKLSYSDVISKLRELGYNTTKNSIESVISNWGLLGEYSALSSPNTFEEICLTINNAIGITEENIKINPPKIKNTSSLSKNLVISDLHVPFYRMDIIRYLIGKYGKNGKKEDRVDKLIINADFFDCYGMSRFIIYKPIPILEEFTIGISLAKILCENFPEVIFTAGNHEQRIFKYFVNKGIGIDKMFLVNYDWIKYISTLFPNITAAKNIIGNEDIGEHEIGHYYLLGKDCAVGHFEIAGGGEVSLKAAHKVMNWAKDWAKYFSDLDNCKLYLQGHCFSEDTELLTKDGWQNYKNINVGDMAATYNIETEQIEYQQISNKFVYDNYKELINFKGSTHDILVTPEHTMVYKNRNKAKYTTIKADKLFGHQYYIPVSSSPEKIENKNNEEYDIDDNLLKLLAWVITEGNYPQDSNGIRISQSDKPKCGPKNITDICDALGQTYSINKKYNANTIINGTRKNYDAYRIHLHSSPITSKIKQLCPNKQIQEWMLHLSTRQFKLLLNELILGDGTFHNSPQKPNSHGYQYSSKNENEINLLQIMCIQNGYRAVKLNRKQKDRNEIFVLSIQPNKNKIKIYKSEKISYNGFVWCVTVPNHTLVVRRNGKHFICGNTHSVGKAAIRGGLKTIGETGCICQIQEYAVRPDAKYKPGVNAWWLVLQENGETLINDSNYILWEG